MRFGGPDNIDYEEPDEPDEKKTAAEDEPTVVRAKNLSICMICHVCEEHFAIKLIEFVKTMSTASNEQEPIGWVCDECIANNKERLAHETH